jgi:hypothetical protein
MLYELKKGKAMARVVSPTEQGAVDKARVMAKRFGEPVTVFAIRGATGKRRFLRKVSA